MLVQETAKLGNVYLNYRKLILYYLRLKRYPSDRRFLSVMLKIADKIPVLVNICFGDRENIQYYVKKWQHLIYRLSFSEFLMLAGKILKLENTDQFLCKFPQYYREAHFHF